MAIRNKTRYAILGILSISPCSGYDIKRFCDKTISHFWNENFGHIYPMLKQLMKEGLIEQEEEGNKRKIYGITSKGKEELCTWLTQPAEPQPPRSELLLKLFFGNYLPNEKIVEMIKEVRKRHFLRLEHYKALESSYVRDENTKNVYWLASLHYGMYASEATIKWCDETIQMLSNN